MPFAAALLFLAAMQASSAPPPEMPGIDRTTLQLQDLSVPGKEVVQTRVDFAPGATVPKHRHPGEEIVYVLSGVIEYRVEGQPIHILRAGEVLSIPRGVIHSAVNVGVESASEVATYITDKGKPLTEFMQ